MHLLVLIAALMLTAACTTAVPDEASAPTGVLLPPRPREVRLDGVDPCSLLTREQRIELGFEGDPKRSGSYVGLFRGIVETCTITGFNPRAIAIGIGVVTTAGIERWQEDDVSVIVRATSASGFPALVAVPTHRLSYCSVEVDVAHGQLLDVQVLDGGQSPPISQGELCSHAERSAGSIMTTLLRQ